MKVDLSQDINRVYQPYLYSRKRFLILYGGSGSGKSYFAAQKVLLRIMSEKPHTILCVRKVAKTLRQSSFALLLGLISQWGVASDFRVQKQEMLIEHIPTGNQIVCMGLDDPEKIKSVTGAGGLGITGIWVEEATELTETDLNQLNLRLRGNFNIKFAGSEIPNHSADYRQIILSFNPISSLHWLKKRFFDQSVDSAAVLQTTYRDNAHIDAAYIKTLNELAKIDESFYTIYAQGEWGLMKGLIYRPFRMSPPPPKVDETFYGMDFGFNNPAALVRVDMYDGEPYLTEEIYEREKTTGELAAMMKEQGIRKDAPIYCDPAEPDRIKELRMAGFDAREAKKGPGSVSAGIIFCKSLVIHTNESNVNLNKENQTYKWAEEKDGTTKEEPAKFNDHAMDAMRYALATHLKKRRPEAPQGNAFKGFGVFG